MDDAELVAGVLGGDRDAFAAIYDRYADRLHDFCHSVLRDRAEAADAMQDTFVLAAQRLHQLRDPTKLRPWLYAIARHESLRRARRRSRVVPTDDIGDTAATGATPEDEMKRTDLAEVVWSAAEGLSERDRALLDLHLRQGLDGQALADAIGVTPGHAYVLMNRLRTQVERSLGALLVARLGRDDCADLAQLLEGWDGRFTVLIRKRVARHVDQCGACADRRKVVASPLALLGAVPLVPAAPELRAAVLGRVDLTAALAGPPADPADPDNPPDRAPTTDSAGQSGPRGPHPGRSSGRGGWRRDGFPPAAFVSRARRAVTLAAAFTVAAGVSAPTAWLLADRERDPVVAAGASVATTAPAGTTTTTAAAASTTTEAATTTSTANAATSTAAARPVTVTAPATVAPTAPPATTTTPAPTTASTTTTGVSTTTTAVATTTTTAAPDDPPSVKTLSVDPGTFYFAGTGCSPVEATVRATVSDDHGIAGVLVTWTTDYSGGGSSAMAEDGGVWWGTVGPIGFAGFTLDRVTVTVRVTDTAGNVATAVATASVLYAFC